MRPSFVVSLNITKENVMAGKVLHMNKRNEILRLKKLGISSREIAKTLNCSRNTISEYLKEDFSDQVKKSESLQEAKDTWIDKVDWNEISQELLKGIPIKVLWEEFCKKEKNFFIDYSGFWKQVKKKCSISKKSMHRIFHPGERTEIDYADGIDIFDPITGKALSTELFVGVLCYSRFIFAEFTFTQKSEDFLSSHINMFEFFGGTTDVISPDNLKTGITRANRYDPVVNPAYSKLADYYQVAVMPARVRTPKDKAIAERTIQIFQRWFYFSVRKEKFTSLSELNQRLQEALIVFNQKKHRILKRTRNELFAEEKPYLRPLPENRYEIETYVKSRLIEDCHFEFEKNFYSAPHTFCGKKLEIWATANIIEVYCEKERIAVHKRAKGEGEWVTEFSHYSPAHQAYATITPQSLIERAEKVGSATCSLIKKIFLGRYPLQNLQRAQGVLSLLKYEKAENLESACLKANEYNQSTLSYIKRILKLQRAQATPENKDIQIKREFNPFLRGDSGLPH